MTQVPPPVHTLAVGPTYSTQYGRLGGYTGTPMSARLEKVKGLFIGMPDSGKSHLIQSCPTGYILNCDKASTSGPAPRAMIWPGIGPDGATLGDNGARVVLVWQHFLDKVKLLLELAAADAPRPSTIFFDTIASMMALLRDHLVQAGGKTSWRELHGQTAWDELYTTIETLQSALHRAGYGCFLLLHVINEKIPLGDNRFSIAPGLTITDNFWSRIQGGQEFVGACRSFTEDTQVQQSFPVTIRGVERTETRMVSVPTRKFYLTVSEPDLGGLTRARTKKPLPTRIFLPSENGWEHLSRVYDEANRL